MREIKGEYISKGNAVAFNALVPSNWHELDKYQYSRIRELLTFSKADKYTIATSLLALLFGTKNYHVLEGLDDELRFELYPLIDFIHEEKPPLKNFFPTLKINKKVCYAPEPDLSNICFGEWCFAHQYYIYYSITRDVRWLNYLIATLYRPLDTAKSVDAVDYDGDSRNPFNENHIEKATLSVTAIEFHIKQAVFAWFGVAVEQIASARENLFPPQAEGEEPATEMQDGKSDTWLTVFRTLIGPKFGTEKELKFTNAMFVLDYLEEQRIEYKKVLAAQK